MHSSFGLPYPAGHWFYSLQDLLDNLYLWFLSLFLGGNGSIFINNCTQKFNISETVEMVIIALLMILMTLSFYLCAILKASF
ncbi:Uncharacterised protein [Escherichia coli]|nr:Uncharacterised protein [Escherichia coli]